jgi:hypothetical protein
MNVPEVGNNYVIVLDREEGLDRMHFTGRALFQTLPGRSKGAEKAQLRNHGKIAGILLS